MLGRSGGDGGCWDMFWRLTGPEYAASSRDRNRTLLRELVAAAVEAHPVDPSGRTLDTGAAFCGTLDLFTAAGFTVVRGPTGAVSGGCPRLTVRHPC